VWNRGGFLRPPVPSWRLCNAEEQDNGNQIMVISTARDKTDFLIANLGSMVALTPISADAAKAYSGLGKLDHDFRSDFG